VFQCFILSKKHLLQCIAFINKWYIDQWQRAQRIALNDETIMFCYDNTAWIGTWSQLCPLYTIHTDGVVIETLDKESAYHNLCGNACNNSRCYLMMNEMRGWLRTVTFMGLEWIRFWSISRNYMGLGLNKHKNPWWGYLMSGRYLQNTNQKTLLLDLTWSVSINGWKY